MIKSTTILSVRRDGQVAVAGDGQVTMGETIVKSDARKVRRLGDGSVITGFAGSTGDAMALLERFEVKLKEYPGNTAKAAIELAKLWRTDRNLRRLESLLIVVDREKSLLLGGAGDVIEPDDGLLAITSSIGQLKITRSIKSGKNPVFLIARNNPARTRITPIITLLLVRLWDSRPESRWSSLKSL